MTIEKGRKSFTFAIVHRVKILLHKWLTELRPAKDNIYLFPGIGQRCIQTITIRKSFRKICKLAGLPMSTELRPHSMRHSYAHILFENN